MEAGLEEVVRLLPAASEPSLSTANPASQRSAFKDSSQHTRPKLPGTAFLTISIHIEQHSVTAATKSVPLETTTFIVRPSFYATNLTSLPVRLHLQGGWLPQAPCSLSSRFREDLTETSPASAMPAAERMHDPLQGTDHHLSCNVEIVDLPNKQPMPIDALWSPPQGPQANSVSTMRSGSGMEVNPTPSMPQQTQASSLPSVSLAVNSSGTWHTAKAGPRSYLQSSSTPDDQQDGSGPVLHGNPIESSTLTDEREQPLILPLLQGGGRRCVWLNPGMQHRQRASSPAAPLGLLGGKQESPSMSSTVMCAVLASSRGSHLVIYEDPQPPLVLSNQAEVALNLLITSELPATPGILHHDAAASGGEHADSPWAARFSPRCLMLQPGGSISCTRQAWNSMGSSSPLHQASGEGCFCLSRHCV